MIKIYGILGMVWLVTLGLFSYIGYNKGYATGELTAQNKCNTELNELKNAINKNNNKEIATAEKQKDAYRIALNIRNDNFKEIETSLRLKVKEIERIKNETANICVNADIPDKFK